MASGLLGIRMPTKSMMVSGAAAGWLGYPNGGPAMPTTLITTPTLPKPELMSETLRIGKRAPLDA